MSLLGVLGVSEIITDTTSKISANFKDIVSVANNTQDNVATVANNAVIGTYNTVSGAVNTAGQIVYDTEVRTLTTVSEFLNRGTELIYDIIEIISYMALFSVVVILSTMLLFHDEIFRIVAGIIVLLNGLGSKYLGLSGMIPR